MLKRNIPDLRFQGYKDEWEERKLGELASDVGTGKSSTFDETDIGGKYPILGSTSVIGYSTTYDYVGEFILTARVGANAGSLYKYSGAVKISDNTVFIKSEYINFLYYNLIKYNLKRLSFGTGQPLIKASEVKNIPISLPTLSEQAKIGQLFASLDKLIQLHSDKLAILTEEKATFLRKMFPDQGQKVPEIRLEGFEGDWEERKFGEVLSVNSGRDYKHLSAGDIPVYGTGGYMLSVNEALSNKDGIGIGRKGTIDKPYLLKAPYWTVDTLFYCVPEDGTNLEFLNSSFQLINWKSLDESTGVPSLSKQTITNLKIPLPPLPEQIAIGNFFQTLDQEIEQVGKKIEELKELKQTLLKRMFV